MAKAGTVTIELEANGAKLEKALKQATADLNSNTAKMSRSLGSLKKEFKSLNDSVGFLSKGLVGLALIQVGKNAIYAADAFNQLQAKIANSVDAGTQVEAVFQKLLASSNRTGTAVGAVAQAFVRIHPAALELDVTNDQLIQFNETFQKMGVLAGATSNEVSQTMIQLSQAIASNRLGGDELRSVLEQMPSVARVIADQMKIPMSQLKDVAKEGKITADVVFDAILGKTKEVDAQFANLPGSVERSMNKVQNSLQATVGEINKTSGATTTLAGLLDGLAATIDNLKAPLVNTTKFILQMGETSLQMGSLVINGVQTAFNGLVTGIAKSIGIALQGIENLVNGATGGLNEVISLANKIPGMKLGSLGTKWKAPGHKFFDDAALGGWQKTSAAAWKTGYDFNSIMSGKSVFNNTGGEAMGTNKDTKSPFDALGDGAEKAGKKAKQAKDEFKDMTLSLEKDFERMRKAMLPNDKRSVFDLTETEGWKNFIASKDDLKSIIESGRTALEAYNDEMARLDKMARDYPVLAKDVSAAQQVITEKFSEANTKTNEWANAVGNVIANFGDKFFDTFIGSLKEGKFAFKEFVASALEDLAKLIFKLTVTIPIAEALTNALGGGTSAAGGGGKKGGGLIGHLLNGIGSLFGGFFADGGFTPGGKPIVVGERGPELFYPGRSGGYIQPNHQLGGGGVTVVQNINVHPGIEGKIRAEIISAAPWLNKEAAKHYSATVNKGGLVAKTTGRR